MADCSHVRFTVEVRVLVLGSRTFRLRIWTCCNCKDMIKLEDLSEKNLKPSQKNKLKSKKYIRFMEDITLSEAGKDFESFSHDDSKQALTERNLNESQQSGIFQIKKDAPKQLKPGAASP